jgi:hypothetical protein
MHKVIRKRIRRSEGGLNIAVDVDAVIAVNTRGDAGVTRTEAHSSHTVVQGEAAGRDVPCAAPTDPPETQEDTP